MGMNYSGGKVDGSSAKVTGISFDSHLDYEGQKVTSKNAIADPVKNDVVDLSDFVGAFYKKTPEEIEAERRAEALRKAEEERKRQEEERKRKAAEEERKRQEELKRLEEAKRAEAARQAEAARLAEEKRKQEEAAAAAAAASQKKGGWSLLGALSSAWDAVTETAAKVVDTAVSVVKEVGNVVEDVVCTAAVAVNSVTAGVLDVVEGITDGAAWLVAGAADLVGADDAALAIRQYIAVDQVGEAQKQFYENTSLGQYINNNSYASYDSAVMQGVRSVAEDVAVFAAATAATVCTGGAAAPLVAAGLGFAYGAGTAAENLYAATGGQTSGMNEAMILLNGGVSALSWVASGKLGSGLIDISKDIAKMGVKEVLGHMAKNMFTKETLKELFKPSNVIGNVIASFMQAGGELGQIATKLYAGQEVTPEEWAILVGELFLYFGLNVAEDFLRDGITGYKSMTPADAGDIADTKADVGKQASNPVDDGAAAKAGDVDNPKVNDTGATPSTKPVHPDDAALAKAEDILNPNTATKLGDFVSESDDELQKIVTAMTGDEIAEQLKSISSPDDVNRILNMLDGKQTDELAGALGEMFSKNGFDPSTFNKLDPVIQLEVLEKTDPAMIAESIVNGKTNVNFINDLSPEYSAVVADELAKKVHIEGNPTYEAYMKAVQDQKVSNAQWDAKKAGGTLSPAEIEKARINGDIVAATTISNLERLGAEGYFKEGYSTEDIVKLIQSGEDPKNYLSPKAIAEWQSDFGTLGKMGSDTVPVYVFQETTNPYCVVNTKGPLGRPGDTGGAFVLSQTKIDEMMSKGIINPDGTVPDVSKLNEALGANYKGPMALIKAEPSVGSLTLPRGNNQGSYLGEWCPGGMTIGGVYEAVIPQTNNYDILAISP